MITLTTGDSIVAKMTGAPATTNPTFYCSWIGTDNVPGNSQGSLNGATEVEIVAAPVSGQKMLDLGIVFNGDTGSNTVIVQVANGANRRTIHYESMIANKIATFGRQAGPKGDTGATGPMADLVDDTTPQLGGDLDLNQKSILHNPAPSTDHAWNGIVCTGVAGENVVIGDVCYYKSDGKLWKADADAEATSKGLLAMATGSISADASGIFLIRGFIRDDTNTWTVGGELFIGTSPGLPSETKPSGSGDIVRVIGYSYAAHVVYFDPSKAYVEVA